MESQDLSCEIGEDIHVAQVGDPAHVNLFNRLLSGNLPLAKLNRNSLKRRSDHIGSDHGFGQGTAARHCVGGERA